MRTSIHHPNHQLWRSMCAAAALASLLVVPVPALADETCLSPYVAKLAGQEEFIYVWTLGVEGLGDGSDKLVTVDARENSSTFGEVIASVSVGGRHEAHHGGFTDDRRYFWAGGLDTSQIFVFDIYTDPARPRLTKTITDFVQDSGGAVGPHTFYALPGRMRSPPCPTPPTTAGAPPWSNTPTIAATSLRIWMPTETSTAGAQVERVADGYGYDVRALPRKNVMLTSAFTGWSNYMMDFGQMLQDETAMQRFGQTVVVWDLHARRPQQVLDVPGAPLEVRFANQRGHTYAFVTTALTSKIWLIHEKDGGTWQATEVADIGNPADIPLPVATSLSADDTTFWVDTFMDGTVRAYDVTDPFRPQQIYEKQIGSQLNMISQSADGKRIYFTSSLLARWDKKGANNEQFLRAYDWDGRELTPRFDIDFAAEQLGRAHLMRFGAGAPARAN